MIDRTVFNSEIAILAEMHRHDLSLPVIDRYYQLLTGRLTTEQFLTACRRLAMTLRAFWPLPAEFLPPVHERLGADALDEAARLEGLPLPDRMRVLPSGPVVYRRAQKPERLAAIVARVQEKAS